MAFNLRTYGPLDATLHTPGLMNVGPGREGTPQPRRMAGKERSHTTQILAISGKVWQKHELGHVRSQPWATTGYLQHPTLAMRLRF